MNRFEPCQGAEHGRQTLRDDLFGRGDERRRIQGLARDLETPLEPEGIATLQIGLQYASADLVG